MPGWNLKDGIITEYNVSEDRLWSLFNFVFSDASRKRNTFKFGFIKALMDNIFNGHEVDGGIFFSYKDLFGRFAANYWNLVVKYGLKQMRKDGKSEYSKIELILNSAVEKNKLLSLMEFDTIDEQTKNNIVASVMVECKKYVIGALYDDFDGVIYSFDLKSDGLILNHCMSDFMLKHKSELERLNYYAWARFLEKINDDKALIRVIEKLELATPRREDLSVYREILKREFEQDNCFYCGKKLSGVIHVDHFIPWSFTKDDKIWNFVLACSTCNERKNNKVPGSDFVVRIENRNSLIKRLDNSIIQADFEGYTDNLVRRMWMYAKMSGLKEFE